MAVISETYRSIICLTGVKLCGNIFAILIKKVSNLGTFLTV
jgi:hypothetical protein